MRVLKEKRQMYKKRALAMFMAFAMVMSSFVVMQPMQAAAWEFPGDIRVNVRKTSLNLADDTKELTGGTYIGDSYISTTEGWSWNPGTKVLTLRGTQIEMPDDSIETAIQLPTNATIVVQKGYRSSIYAKKGSISMSTPASSSLTITGGGHLEMTTEDDVAVVSDAISIEGQVHVTVSGSPAAIKGSTLEITDAYLKAKGNGTEYALLNTANANSSSQSISVRAVAAEKRTKGDVPAGKGQPINIVATGTEKIKEFQITSATSTMSFFGMLQMNAVGLPQGMNNRDVSWSVATVEKSLVDAPKSCMIDQNGMLTAGLSGQPIQEGLIMVVAQAQDGSGVFATKVIRIVAPAMAHTEVEGNKTQIQVGETVAVSAATPISFASRRIDFSIDNSQIASIAPATHKLEGYNEDGSFKEGLDVFTTVVTGLKPGTVTVTATAWMDQSIQSTFVFEVVSKPFNAGNYSYTIKNDGTAELNGFAKGKSSTTVSVPSTVKNPMNGISYKVTSIKRRAFHKNKRITKATLGKNVVTVGSSAFSECSKLKEVTIYDKTKTIKKYAFYKNSSLKKVTIGTGLKTIEYNVFKNDTKLRSLIIKSKKLTKVGKNNLYNCKDLTIDVHSSKVKAYTKLFKKQGQKQNVKIK